MEISPKDRVFHIDRECYIIYLGSDPDDYKPFLRIGNSPFLPDIIKKNIYYIVITDSLTGNPLVEPDNINQENIHENKYVGDKKSLSEFFKFLYCFNIKTEGYPISDSLKTNENKAVISYFEDGNLTIHYNKNLIFDLKKREKEDLHFIELAKKIKNQLKLDPLFLGYNFFSSVDSGFIHIKESIIFINRGNFFADELPDNYFETLAHYRLDPDLIKAVIKEGADKNLVKILKRKLILNEKLDIIPKSKDKVIECTVNLFRKKKDLFRITNEINSNEVSIAHEDGLVKIKNKKSNKEYIKEIIITNKRKPQSVYIEDSKNSLSKNKKPFYISRTSKEITYKIRQKVYHHPLIEGIPYILNDDSEIDIKKTETIINDTLSFFKNIINTQETSLCNSFKLFLKSELKGDEKLADNFLKASERLLKRTKITLVASILLLSIINLAKYTLSIKNNKKVLKRLMAIEDKLKNHINRIDQPNLFIPLVANIYSNFPIIIFSLSKVGLSSTDYQYSIDNEREIGAFSGANLNIFETSRSKLENLIESLMESSIAKPKKHILKSGEKKEDLFKPVTEALKTKTISEITEIEKVETKKVQDITSPTNKISRQVKTETKISGTVVPKKKKQNRKKLVLMIIPIISAIMALGLYFAMSSRIKIVGLKEKKAISKNFNSSKESSSTNMGKTSTKNKIMEEISEKKELTAEKTSFSEKETSKSETGIKKDTLSKKGIETFLDLGYIKITILDVYKLTNKIAKSNGYRTLDNPNELGKDPNWIYPGNRLKLPDSAVYTVKKGDTIWYIAKRFIKKELDSDWPEYRQLQHRIKTGNLDNKTKSDILGKLMEMKNKTYSENFKKLLDNLIKDLNK